MSNGFIEVLRLNGDYALVSLDNICSIFKDTDTTVTLYLTNRQAIAVYGDLNSFKNKLLKTDDVMEDDLK